MCEGVVGRESGESKSSADRLFEASGISQCSYKTVVRIEIAGVVGDSGTEILDGSECIALRKLV